MARLKIGFNPAAQLAGPFIRSCKWLYSPGLYKWSRKWLHSPRVCIYSPSALGVYIWSSRFLGPNILCHMITGCLIQYQFTIHNGSFLHFILNEQINKLSQSRGIMPLIECNLFYKELMPTLVLLLFMVINGSDPDWLIVRLTTRNLWRIWSDFHPD